MNTRRLFVAVPAGNSGNCGRGPDSFRAPGNYENRLECDARLKHLLRDDYAARLEYAREHGFDTLVYTGDCDPLSNPGFMENVESWNSELARPFRRIELETTIESLDEKTLLWLRNRVSVSTVSLFIPHPGPNSSFLDIPQEIAQDPETFRVRMESLGLNLKLTVRLTILYEIVNLEALFASFASVGARIVELKKPFGIDDRISCPPETIERIGNYVFEHGTPAKHRSECVPEYYLGDMRVSVDTDSDSRARRREILVLGPDARLYTEWGVKASLLF